MESSRNMAHAAPAWRPVVPADEGGARQPAALIGVVANMGMQADAESAESWAAAASPQPPTLMRAGPTKGVTSVSVAHAAALAIS